jgi:putative spermidine/putrescine transport system permease protein
VRLPRVAIPLRMLLTACSVVLLLGPTTIVVVASVSEGRQIVFPPHGFTLDWYGEIVGDGPTWNALLNSFHVAAVAVAVCLLFGVPAALALPTFGAAKRLVVILALSLGLSTPIIVSAFSFFEIFTQTGVYHQLTAVGVAVGIVNLPFMVWPIMSAIEDQDVELPAAAATLGADPVEQFLFVRMPLVTPGIVTGAILVFVLSITDFVVSQVLTTPANQTLPVFIYSGLRTSISPGLGAAAALFIGIATAVFIVVLRLGGVERFLLRRGASS